ncbi:MAG: 4-(cytidine 5'-diphospho)-2-C-methyl-D-erythritol kinase [Oscillospiraceae bacterium]|nr:4-(cytidine 5'-diphospho)-2-C-methyl-D-erythritol kinase [Oscillospiraceae bacterium]
MKNSIITVKAYSKLNFFLDILGRRSDGYHEIRTTMLTVDLCDDVRLGVSDGDGVFLTCTEPEIPLDERNTAYKAAKLFLEKAGVKKQVDIDIIKRIPVGGGLGGSSADAAAVLRALNELFGELFDLSELLEIGTKVGADVPFCIHGGFALCTGTGTEIAEVFPVPAYIFVIVKPNFSCSSKKAYAMYDKKKLSETPFRGCTDVFNIFEKLYNNPEIEKIKNNLIQLGAVNASLSGSGSAVFGVFEDINSAERAYAAMKYTEKFIARPIVQK